MGDTVTYAAHRALLPRTVAREGIQQRGHHLVSRHRHHQPRRHRKLGARRRLPPIAERSVRRLAIVGRGARCDAANVLTRGAETAPVADADHAPHVRGRLDRHRPMDRSAAEPRARCRGHPADRPVRGVLLLRRLGRQHRLARRPAPADHSCLRHERTRSSRSRTARRCGCGWKGSWATRA